MNLAIVQNVTQGLCDDGEGNCIECGGDGDCSDWEEQGWGSYEECMCNAGYSEFCPGDPCDDWEGNGYGSYEECTCANYGENCEEPEEEEPEEQFCHHTRKWTALQKVVHFSLKTY